MRRRRTSASGPEARWLLAAAIAAAAGCAAPQSPGPAGRAAAEPAAPDAGSPLAAQARRDVEQLRDLARGRPGDLEAGERSGSPGPPAIQWNEPVAARGPGAAADPTEIAEIAGQPALGRDRPADPAEAETPGGAVAEPAAPSDAPRDRLRQLLVEVSAELYRRGAYSDMPLRELLLIAATPIVTPDRGLAVEALPGLTDREREILARWQEFCAESGSEMASTGDPEVLVRELEKLVGSLVREPQLKITNAALCMRVGGFGDYDEFAVNEADRYAFLAGTAQQAVVYVEIEDFASELNDKDQWVTELSQELVVYSDRDGIPVQREGWQAGVDKSRKKRQDFFVTQLVTLARGLTVGRYQLKIRVRDEKSGAEAETAIDFEMVADARMATYDGR